MKRSTRRIFDIEKSDIFSIRQFGHDEPLSILIGGHDNEVTLHIDADKFNKAVTEYRQEGETNG
ncbi:MAG: hypothetical protein EHM41_00260 [Chloroflexi bacterium]|nr:MAG: hypothetical protein EHM41_00260 [Chloroflexota bacterium]